MVDIATLGIAVDSRPVVKASGDLNALQGAARKAEAATEGLERASNAAAAAITREGAAANSNIPKVNRMSGSMSGLAAQFQDIGVTAAMGMNPLIIGLQQGTQIAGQMEAAIQGGSSAASVLGNALKSLFQPLTFAAIGLTVLAAAGLQFINWVHVGQAALRTLADALEWIAPAAAVAAGGLALVYAPAIIGGFQSVIVLIGTMIGRATVAAGAFALMWAAANPAGAMVIAFAAVVTAAVIFRDELTRLIGVDIVGVIEKVGNRTIGIFVGAYNAVAMAWSNLPLFFGTIGKQAWNAFVSEFEKPALVIGGQTIIPGLDLSGMKSDLTGAEKGALGKVSAKFDQDLNFNYIGAGIDMAVSAAGTAADKLRALADSFKEVDKEAEKLRKKYAEIVTGANQFIAAQELERQVLGMTTVQANTLRYAQDLLNEATDKGIKLTAAQRAELLGLAAQMAQSEETTRRWADAFTFAKDTAKGFLSDFRNGLKEGEGIWSSFANAALNALGKISDKLFDLATDQLINGFLGKILGGIMGGITGPGIGGATNWMFAKGAAFSHGNVVPFAAGAVVTGPTPFPMSNGRTGIMGEAGEEGILPLRRGPNGRLGVSSYGGGGSGALDVNVTVTVDDQGSLQAYVTKAIDKNNRHKVPKIVFETKGNSILATGQAA